MRTSHLPMTGVHRLWPVLCCSLLLQPIALAQPAIDLDRVLFEPHPIPTAAVGEFEAAASQPMHSVANISDAAAALPLVLTGSNSLVNDPKAAIAAYQQSISNIEAEAGPFSLALAEQLLGLSDAYQRAEQYDEAIATLEKAEYINRINNGLSTPLQIDIVRRMVQTYLASGNFGEAFSRQQHLSYLNRELYGPASTELIPSLVQQGDLNMQSFTVGIHSSNSIGAQFNFGGQRNRTPVTPRRLALTSLDQAHARYLQAIQLMVNNGNIHDPQLIMLEEKLLQCIFLAGHRRGLESNPGFYLNGRIHLTGTRISVAEFENNLDVFMNGKYALERIYLYLRTAPNVRVVQLVDALLNLGDWHLLFNRSSEAAPYYQQADELVGGLEKLGYTADPLLNPSLPRQLPGFVPLPHSRAALGVDDTQKVRFSGYIDVEFSRTKKGDVRQLQVIGSSPNTSKPLERRLRRLLGSLPFRPTLEDGQPVDSTLTQVRYYFAEIPESSPATLPQL